MPELEINIRTFIGRKIRLRNEVCEASQIWITETSYYLFWIPVFRWERQLKS